MARNLARGAVPFVRSVTEGKKARAKNSNRVRWMSFSSTFSSNSLKKEDNPLTWTRGSSSFEHCDTFNPKQYSGDASTSIEPITPFDIFCFFGGGGDGVGDGGDGGDGRGDGVLLDVVSVILWGRAVGRTSAHTNLWSEEAPFGTSFVARKSSSRCDGQNTPVDIVSRPTEQGKT